MVHARASKARAAKEIHLLYFAIRNDKKSEGKPFAVEVPSGFEPLYEVLQTSA